jgi:hypothetical protein
MTNPAQDVTKYKGFRIVHRIGDNARLFYEVLFQASDKVWKKAYSMKEAKTVITEAILQLKTP